MTQSFIFIFLTIVKSHLKKGADGNVLCLVNGEYRLGSKLFLLS